MRASVIDTIFQDCRRRRDIAVAGHETPAGVVQEGRRLGCCGLPTECWRGCVGAAGDQGLHAGSVHHHRFMGTAIAEG